MYELSFSLKSECSCSPLPETMEEALNLGKKSSSVVEDVMVADQGVVQGEEEEAVNERTPLLKH